VHLVDVRKMGELELAILFTCVSWLTLMHADEKLLLPRMHYVKPLGRRSSWTCCLLCRRATCEVGANGWATDVNLSTSVIRPACRWGYNGQYTVYQ
jgi:hypothetical protein